MTGPAEFLAARLDEDRQVAHDALDRDWLVEDNYVESTAGGEIARFEIKADARHAAAWSPRRALADVAAKRRMLEVCTFGYSDDQAEGVAYDVLLALVQPHADHPDFDPAWKVVPA